MFPPIRFDAAGCENGGHEPFRSPGHHRPHGRRRARASTRMAAAPTAATQRRLDSIGAPAAQRNAARCNRPTPATSKPPRPPASPPDGGSPQAHAEDHRDGGRRLRADRRDARPDRRDHATCASARAASASARCACRWACSA
jgi:hypothetical protein